MVGVQGGLTSGDRGVVQVMSDRGRRLRDPNRSCAKGDHGKEQGAGLTETSVLGQFHGEANTSIQAGARYVPSMCSCDLSDYEKA